MHYLNMRSLSEFSTYQEVFKNASALPTFFESNLVDPGRVVKSFLNDPQAHIRIFYYQYLRLCFELDNQKSQSYVQRLQELINNATFQFIFYQDDDPSIYNDSNAKGLISQFFQLLGSGQHTVLEAVNNNPIMDVILVHFFRTLLILTQQTENLDNYIQKEQLIDYLCNFFGVEVQFHGQCCHYVESDIFVYEENEAAVYMAYISPYDAQNHYQAEHLQSREEIRQPTYPQPLQDKYLPAPIESKYHPAPAQTKSQPPPVQTKYQPAPPAQPKYQPAKPAQLEANRHTVGSQAYQTGKESYIASEFVDYTHTSEPLDNKVKTNLKGSGTHFNAASTHANGLSVGSSYYSLNNVESLANPNKPLAFIETASISSNSENKNVSEYVQQMGSYQPDYLTKSNPINRGQVTHLHFEELPSSNSVTPVQPKPLTPSPASAYQAPAVQSIPTKDYPVVPSYNAQTSQYGAQSGQYGAQSGQYGAQSGQYGAQNQYYSSSSKVESTLPAKPLSSALPDTKKDLFYNPKIQSSSYNQYNYNSTKAQSFQYKSTVSQGLTPKTPAPVTPVNVVAGKKKPFGLNVSEEFTNSLTMQSMSEPFKSSVHGMKSRARNFRASLANYIK